LTIIINIITTMKKYILLMMTTLLITVFGSSPAWAQTTLVDFNFTDNEKFPTSTTFADDGVTKMTVDTHDIYFYHNNPNKASFSLSSSGLTFGDNNMSSNYFVAIPLTGIKGEITVTFTHEYSSNKASYRYNIVDGATKYTTSGGNATTSVSDANNSDVTIEKTFQVNSENAVFYFGRNGSNYTRIKGIKITTPTTASKPKLTTFEFNNDDILYYCNTTGNTSAGRSAATSVSTTFEKNADYGENGYLRVKVNIEPDFSTPGNVAGLGRFDDLIGFPVFGSIYVNNSNIFAAIPSLHSAYMLIATIYAVMSRQSKGLILCCCIVTLGIWCTAVYSCHHYVIDVLLGILTAFVGIAIFEQVVMRLPFFKRFFQSYANYIS
jgi:hypothetical protein